MDIWTIRRRIIVSFGGILCMLIFMGFVSFGTINDTRKEAQNIMSDAAPGIVHSSDFSNAIIANYAHLNRHLSFKNKSDKQQNKTMILSNRTHIQEKFKLYEATIYKEDEKKLFNNFTSLMREYWLTQDQFFTLDESTQNKEEVYLFLDSTIIPIFDKTNKIINDIADYNEKNIITSSKNIDESAIFSKYANLGSTIFVFLFCFTTGYFLLQAIIIPLQNLVTAMDSIRQGDFTNRMKIIRSDEFGIVAEGFNRMTDELSGLVGQVQKSGLQVTTSVTEIAATSKQQQATATSISVTTAEIGATSKQISSTSKQLVQTLSEVSNSAIQSAALASNGQVGLSNMGKTMHEVMEATKAINAKLIVLNEKAGNIGQVITTISKVAEQTNLLSLNAAIEAEKAGEHGRGFSVVATEIRRLADQTAVATYDIGQTVKEIQAAVSSSVMGMDKFSDEVKRGIGSVQEIGEQLSQIIHQTQNLAPRIEDANIGMQEQAYGAEQISEALALLNESSQQTVESLRQSTMAIDDLNQVAHGLRGGVSRFKLK